MSLSHLQIIISPPWVSTVDGSAIEATDPAKARTGRALRLCPPYYLTWSSERSSEAIGQDVG